MADSIGSILDKWSAAEQAGDTGRLDALLAGLFAGIGPLGVTPAPAGLAWPPPLTRPEALRIHVVASLSRAAGSAFSVGSTRTQQQAVATVLASAAPAPRRPEPLRTTARNLPLAARCGAKPEPD